jgi:hypothetical protein
MRARKPLLAVKWHTGMDLHDAKTLAATNRPPTRAHERGNPGLPQAVQPHVTGHQP